MFPKLEPSDLGEGGWAVFSTPESVLQPPPLAILMVVEGKDRALAENFLSGMVERDKFFVGHMREINFAKGVAWLRWVIFERDDHRCVKCTKTVTWSGPGAGEMHERVKRGQGGTRNVYNSELLCQDCHTGTRGEHGLGARSHTPSKIFSDL